MILAQVVLNSPVWLDRELPLPDEVPRLGDLIPLPARLAVPLWATPGFTAVGLGLILIVSPYYANHIRTMIQEHGFDCWAIGEIVAGQSGAAWA